MSKHGCLHGTHAGQKEFTLFSHFKNKDAFPKGVPEMGELLSHSTERCVLPKDQWYEFCPNYSKEDYSAEGSSVAQYVDRRGGDSSILPTALACSTLAENLWFEDICPVNGLLSWDSFRPSCPVKAALGTIDRPIKFLKRAEYLTPLTMDKAPRESISPYHSKYVADWCKSSKDHLLWISMSPTEVTINKGLPLWMLKEIAVARKLESLVSFLNFAEEHQTHEFKHPNYLGV